MDFKWWTKIFSGQRCLYYICHDSQLICSWNLGCWVSGNSGLRRVTCICCCSVSNVAGQACWQQGWKRVWRASTHWWSRHLKPALHLSAELSLSLHLLYVVHFLWSVAVCFIPSPLLLFVVLIISSFAFLVSLNLSTSSCLHLFLICGICSAFSASISLAVAGFPVYHASQEAVVWDIPVFTVIDYRLSSFYRSLVVL